MSFCSPPQQVHLIVGQALKRYSEDRVGMVDYALESAGRWWWGSRPPGTSQPPWGGDRRGAGVRLTCCRPLSLPGASVINTRCSETYETRTALLSLFGIPLWYHSQSPRVILQVGTLGARPPVRGWTGWAGSRVGLMDFIGLSLLLPASGQVDVGGRGGRKLALMVIILFVSHSCTCSQMSILGTAGRFVGPKALLSSASLVSSAPQP